MLSRLCYDPTYLVYMRGRDRKQTRHTIAMRKQPPTSRDPGHPSPHISNCHNYYAGVGISSHMTKGGGCGRGSHAGRRYGWIFPVPHIPGHKARPSGSTCKPFREKQIVCDNRGLPGKPHGSQLSFSFFCAATRACSCLHTWTSQLRRS
jgi:hypothetical protein